MKRDPGRLAGAIPGIPLYRFDGSHLGASPDPPEQRGRTCSSTSRGHSVILQMVRAAYTRPSVPVFLRAVDDGRLHVTLLPPDDWDQHNRRSSVDPDPRPHLGAHVVDEPREETWWNHDTVGVRALVEAYSVATPLGHGVPMRLFTCSLLMRGAGSATLNVRISDAGTTCRGERPPPSSREDWR